MKILNDLLYTKNHEWLKVEDNKAYIGITDFAQHQLGDMVFVELPEIDSEYEIEESCAALESVKAASDVYIPVSGTIVEVNEEVADDPSILNQDPYANWMVCVELSDKAQLDNLMDAVAYEAHCSKGV